MKFRDLKIETLRQAPSDARTEALSLLIRANYLTHENRPTLLGQKLIDRLGGIHAGRPTTFFEKLLLPVLQVEDEFFFETPRGGVTLLRCPTGDYTARRQGAKFQKKINPASPLMPLEKVYTPECNTIDSLAQFLGISKGQTAKAWMYTRATDGRFVFVAVRGDMQLSDAKLEKIVGKHRLAGAEEIMLAGAVGGYASPIGMRDELVIVDDLIPDTTNLVVGANEAGYHWTHSNYGRDYSADIVADVVLASPGDACPRCGAELVSSNADGLFDGSGYQFENILAAMAEVRHDERGLIFQAGASAFDVYLMQIQGKETNTFAQAGELYTQLQDAGISVF